VVFGRLAENLKNQHALSSNSMDIQDMKPDKDLKDPARQETQEFDPALLDEEGIHPTRATHPETSFLEQEQRDEVEEQPEHGGGWQSFQSP
jgi:hypothetical protein